MTRWILAFILLPVLVFAAAGDKSAMGKSSFELPKDFNGVALQGTSLGLPTFSEAVTLTTTAFVALITLPTTAPDTNRQWRGLVVRNPDTGLSLYLCFGGSSSCSTTHIKVPPSTTLVFDHLFFGPMNSITKIYGKLSNTGSVIPEVTVW